MSFSELMQDCEMKPLSELLDFIVDNRGKSVPTAEFGIPLIATNCIKNSELFPTYEKVRYVSKEIYASWFRAHPKPGDIIFVNKGKPGSVVMVPDPVDFCIAQDMMAFRANKSKIYNKFLFAVLRSAVFQTQIMNYHVGTMIPHFKKGDLDKLLIPVPDMKIQEYIGNLYYTFSYKIEINNQINKTLENMAQAIFKQWFVDFEFPNEDGEPYKSSGGEMVESELGMIPKGWEVVQFRDVFKFVKGKKPKIVEECEFEGSEKYLTIDVLNRNSVLFCSNEKIIEANSKDVLMVMDGASSGAVYFGQKGVVASTLAKLELISKKVSNQFLFYMIKYFENDIKTHTTGSAIPHTDKEYTYRLMIALPNDISLQIKINDLLCGISDTFIAREQENEVLKVTRDSLLPKLMSGEIRVPLDEEGAAS